MNQLRRVMVAVDVSEAARAAFDRALALSRAHDAELTVVHAVPTDRGFEWDALKRIALTAALRRDAEAAGVRTTLSVQHGDPAGVILLHARARTPDLIVLGTNKRSGLDRFRLGSVAEAVALRSTIPVLIVPASTDRAAASRPLKNIVVAVDFTGGSVAAVEQALKMADAGSRVTLVHAVPGVAPAATPRYMYRLMESEYQRGLVQDARKRMAAIMPQDAKARLHARVVAGDPASELVRVANEVEADVILVGVTTRGALGRFFRASTAARVIRTAGRAVLAIPERGGTPIADDSQAERLAIAA